MFFCLSDCLSGLHYLYFLPSILNKYIFLLNILVQILKKRSGLNCKALCDTSTVAVYPLRKMLMS